MKKFSISGLEVLMVIPELLESEIRGHEQWWSEIRTLTFEI